MENTVSFDKKRYTQEPLYNTPLFIWTINTFWANSANEIFKYFFLFLPENRLSHFMQTAS